MTEFKEPFVASLWKKGSPVEFAAEDLARAADWADAEKLALDWAEIHISQGGLAVPTLLYLKHGPKSKLVREWRGI